MSQFSEADLIVFIHIPKTAGTSFASFLESKLYHFDQQSIAIRPRTLLTGHNYLHLTYSNLANGYLITFLREPISRTISQYRSLRNPLNYAENWREEWDAQQVAALEFCQKATLSEFIRSDDLNVLSHIVNAQTRMLADFKIGVQELLQDSSLQDRSLLSASESLLQKIDFLGIYEEMAASMVMFSRETGLHGDLPHLNRSTPFDANLTPGDLCRIRSLTYLDSQLYELGMHLFRERAQASGGYKSTVRGP